MSDSDQLRKAAVLVSALDTAMADRLFDQMSEAQAARVRRRMVELEDIDPAEQQAVIAEFFRIAEPTGYPPSDKFTPLKFHRPSTASSALLNEIEAEPAFHFLRNASGDKITPLVAGEHPQTIALVVSHLSDDRAAEVLGSLDSDVQVEVMRRMVDLEAAHPDVVREVERGLQSRIVQHLRIERRREQGMATVARILAAAEPRVRDTLIDSLVLHDQALAARLMPPRQELTFTDLESLAPREWAVLVAHADAEVVRLALWGASPLLVDRLLAGLPAAESRRVRRSLEQVGALRLSDVDDAQRELVALVERLQLAPRSAALAA